MQHGDVAPALARGLLKLKDRIDAAGIPSSRIDETINIATWNIREFGRKRRSEAAIHYLAEILGQFDLVSIVELRENVSDLKRVLAILGPEWRAVYSGAVPDDGGNGERIGFIFDRRAIGFEGMAAVAVPPRVKVDGEYLIQDRFWWRLPYMASFRAGSFEFILIAAHIRWGSGETDRLAEIELLAQWIDAFRKSEQATTRDLIVVGDFNIPSRRSALFKAITRYGLHVPKALLADSFGSNLARNKRYDQILQYPSEAYPDSFADKGGVLDFHVSDAHMAELFPPEQFPAMTMEKYTYQLSDHLPLWIQVRTDDARAKLEAMAAG
ncbi:endonuclease [Azoarcus sp. DD4]|uniref:endonuclease/exonuclease/phosphatase family protein n=1 Tax=Azoarcus sp. DD4 TaxID=2027405 RepID=UPI00112E2442|nr:endonuclease/exonuclease/phosphatase family protein [Azoarcus sp. DD4]QDF98054.1 endonuclease [Azoarcus sp. DD4]